MRFCGAFHPGQELSGPENGEKPYRFPCERLVSALFAVDDADGGGDDEARGAQRVDRCEQRAARGDDVLDEAHGLAGFVGPFEPLAGAVLLRLLADDEERQAAFERRRSRERDGAKLWAGEPVRVRCVLAHRRGDAPAERAQEVGPRLEAVLVEVVPRPLARAEEEVALEIGRVDERSSQLLVVQRRAAATASRAIGRSVAASGDPSANEIIEPSPK